jgi:hypothetical protein
MSKKKPKQTLKAVQVKLGKQTPMPKPVVNETSASSNSDKKK